MEAASQHKLITLLFVLDRQVGWDGSYPLVCYNYKSNCGAKTIHHGLGNVENNLKQEDCLQNVVFHCQDDNKKIACKKV